LTFTGTDADTVIKNRIQISSGEDGELMILGQLIDDVIRKLDDGAEVTVERDGSDELLRVASGKSKFKLMCQPCETFPNFEEQNMSENFKISRESFLSIIDKTRFAVSDDASRYYLNGAYLHTVVIDGKKKLAAVGTDGRKLAMAQIDFDGAAEVSGIIVPKKTIPEIKKVLSLVGDKEIEVSFSKTKIKIQTSRSTLISKLIDAEFPDYRKVIPAANDKTLVCDKVALNRGINRISSVVTEAHRGIRLIADKKDSLTLEAASAKSGSADEEIPAEFSGNERIEIAFNSRNLSEILYQIESGKIEFALADNFSAAIIRGQGETQNTFVLMPVKI
jgi:DNA polymerase-3 subunit beta